MTKILKYIAIGTAISVFAKISFRNLVWNANQGLW